MSCFRFEFDGPVGHQGRVFFVASDGTETDISACVSGVDFHASVKDINTATIHVVNVKGYAKATEAVNVIVTNLPRRRGWRARVREVTHLGSKTREYVA